MMASSAGVNFLHDATTRSLSELTCALLDGNVVYGVLEVVEVCFVKFTPQARRQWAHSFQQESDTEQIELRRP